jgi:hypothetical protein
MTGFFGPDIGAYPTLFQFLEWFYPGVSDKNYNLEEVLAFLELSRTRLPIWGLSASAAHCADYNSTYNQVLAYMGKRLNIPRGRSCSLHRRLFQTLNNSDTILTLNYDLISDQTLLEIEPKEHGHPHQNSRIGKLEGLLQEQNLAGALQPPSLMRREREWGFYLKLHGSLDWLYCPTKGCRNFINIFPVSVSSLPDGQEPGKPCRFCGAAIQTMIIPPVAMKRLEDRGRTAFHWNLALQELRSATDVVVIGLSLAPSDFELRWLLREGLAAPRSGGVRMHLVNPNKSHRRIAMETVRAASPKVIEYDTIDKYIKCASGGA